MPARCMSAKFHMSLSLWSVHRIHQAKMCQLDWNETEAVLVRSGFIKVSVADTNKSPVPVDRCLINQLIDDKWIYFSFVPVLLYRSRRFRGLKVYKIEVNLNPHSLNWTKLLYRKKNLCVQRQQKFIASLADKFPASIDRLHVNTLWSIQKNWADLPPIELNTI